MALQTVEPPAPAAPDELAEGPTTATRYLCVGAYVDPQFRDRCLREVYHQTRRLVAPSYGFDLVTVLWHCLRARRLTLCRDFSIVLALGVTAYLDWRALAGIGAAMIALGTTGAAIGLLVHGLKEGRLTPVTETAWHRRRARATLLVWAIAWLGVVVLAAVILSSAPRPAADLPHPTGIGAAIPAVIAVFSLPCVFGVWRQMRIEDFAADRPAPPVGRNARLCDIAEQQGANTIVYSNFEPFIGSGDVISTWGFATRLVGKEQDKREFDEPPFTAEEIVSYVRDHLRQLTTGDPETRIPNLTVEDRIFLSAREHGERGLFTAPDEMSEIIRNPTQPARHYLVCQVVSWDGEVVTTVHVHIAVQGRSLYLEVTTTSMAPCNERYRIVDLEGGKGPRAWGRALAAGVGETPGTIVRAPARLLRTLIEVGGLRARRRRRTRRPTDRGALVSVRQLGTKDRLRNFTQRKDVLKFRRLIEIRVYAHVLDFLDEHGVDTTEYRARSASVLNVGVISTGETTIYGDVSGTSTTTEQTGD